MQPEFALKANDAESEKKARVLKKAMKNFDTNYAESEEYSTWVPPTSKLCLICLTQNLFFFD